MIRVASSLPMASSGDVTVEVTYDGFYVTYLELSFCVNVMEVVDLPRGILVFRDRRRSILKALLNKI